MKVDIRRLQVGDERILDNLDPDVFDGPIIPEQLSRYLADPAQHIVVAIAGDTVIGMASGLTYFHPDKALQFFINEVGVATYYRRQGIGRQLLDAIMSVARDLGCSETWLGTEYDNDAANALYRAANGEQESFILYTFKL